MDAKVSPSFLISFLGTLSGSSGSYNSCEVRAYPFAAKASCEKGLTGISLGSASLDDRAFIKVSG